MKIKTSKYTITLKSKWAYTTSNKSLAHYCQTKYTMRDPNLAFRYVDIEDWSQCYRCGVPVPDEVIRFINLIR